MEEKINKIIELLTEIRNEQIKCRTEKDAQYKKYEHINKILAVERIEQEREIN